MKQLFTPNKLQLTRQQYPIINYLDWEDKCLKEVVFFNNLFNSGTAFGRPLSKDLDCLIEKKRILCITRNQALRAWF